MDPNQETLETWNKVASLYQDKFMNLDLYNNSYDEFCIMIPTKSSVFEIGCGPGNISKYVLNKRPDCKIDGIDFSPNMIMLAQQNVPEANFQVMDCRDIHTITDKYNAIVCGFCIPYLSIQECENLIEHCNKLLNADGILYISFVEGDVERSGYHTGSTGDRTFFYFYDSEVLTRMLTMNNFIIKYSDLKEYNRGSIIERHIILIGKKIADGQSRI